MLAQPKILVVDDDPTCRRIIGQSLLSAGYRVIESPDGVRVRELVHSEQPALVILDVQMPGRDGWETLEDLRRHDCMLPVLMLTSCVDVSQRIRGLREGADDYIGKGCHPGELLARVHALLRRVEVASAQTRWLRIGAVTVDLEGKAAWRNGERFTLTKTEYLLLKLFAQNLGKPVTRETMLDRVWGYDRLPSTRTIDTHLWRLRKKIGGAEEDAPWLRNVPGAGYVMTCETGEAAAPAGDLLSAAHQ